MKFYSGKGDGGTTTLFGSGKRIPKTDKIFAALGALDELNSYLGICKVLSKDKKIIRALNEVQENLFTLQADVANVRNRASNKFGDPKLGKEKIKNLEKVTNDFGNAVGIITKFTLSGGTLLSAHLDYARALTRKTEREIINLGSRDLSKINITYLNRLSSLLFVLARYANKKAGKKEKNPKYK